MNDEKISRGKAIVARIPSLSPRAYRNLGDCSLRTLTRPVCVSFPLEAVAEPALLFGPCWASNRNKTYCSMCYIVLTLTMPAVLGMMNVVREERLVMVWCERCGVSSKTIGHFDRAFVWLCRSCGKSHERLV